eukprot:GHVU01160504.1.p1 GENE.GHVU01160504.1~~GHVU01160504.1.p1  ORF type:complete len:953 (-),score=152.74 GHVU01160504.1:1505-4363(-)
MVQDRAKHTTLATMLCDLSRKYTFSTSDFSDIITEAAGVANVADEQNSSIAFLGKVAVLAATYSIERADVESLVAAAQAPSSAAVPRQQISAGASSERGLISGNQERQQSSAVSTRQRVEVPERGHEPEDSLVGTGIAATEEEEEEESSESDASDTSAAPASGSATPNVPRSRSYAKYKTIDTISKELGATRWLAAQSHQWTYHSSTKASKTKYYKCASHQGCDAKLALKANADESFTAKAAGKHGKHRLSKKSKGVPPALRPYVDKLAKQGMQAHEITTLTNKAAVDDGLETTPAKKYQVHNWLRRERKQAKKNVNLDTVADLRAWAQAREVNTIEEFQRLRRDQMFVPPGGACPDALHPGVCLTTPALLENFVVAHNHPDPFLLSADTTWRLHYGKFGLLVGGTQSLTWDGVANRQSFRPGMVRFSSSESTAAYHSLIDCSRVACRRFFDVDIHVDLSASDHSEAAYNGIHAHFPEVIHLNCWPHVCRNARKAGVVWEVMAIHKCVTKEQCQAVHAAIVRGMEADDQVAEAKVKFIKTTYGGRWLAYHVGASGHPGVTPTINPCERYNKRWKNEDKCGGLRLATEPLLELKMPEVLRRHSETMGSNQPYNENRGIVTGGMVQCAAYVMKLTQQYLHTGGNLYIDATPGTKQPMDTKRLRDYDKGRKGIIDPGVHYRDICNRYLNVVRVDRFPIVPGQGETTASGAGISGETTSSGAGVSGETTASGAGVSGETTSSGADIYGTDAASGDAAPQPSATPAGTPPHAAIRRSLADQGPTFDLDAGDDALDAGDDALDAGDAAPDADDAAPDADDAAPDADDVHPETDPALTRPIANEEGGQSDDDDTSVVAEETAVEDEVRKAIISADETELNEPADNNGDSHHAAFEAHPQALSRYECCCGSFWRTKVCWHIVLYQALRAERDLTADIARLPRRTRRGAPTKPGPCTSGQW